MKALWIAVSLFQFLFNNISTLVGHFVCLPKKGGKGPEQLVEEREK